MMTEPTSRPRIFLIMFADQRFGGGIVLRPATQYDDCNIRCVRVANYCGLTPYILYHPRGVSDLSGAIIPSTGPEDLETSELTEELLAELVATYGPASYARLTAWDDADTEEQPAPRPPDPRLGRFVTLVPELLARISVLPGYDADNPRQCIQFLTLEAIRFIA